jgi:predicted membrane protein
MLETLSDVVSLMALLAAMAFLIESAVELLVASWLWRNRPERVEDRAVVLRLSSSALGVLFAVLLGLDLVEGVVRTFHMTPVYALPASIAGRCLTGILLGRGAQWFHDMGMTWINLDGVQERRLPQ